MADIVKKHLDNGMISVADMMKNFAVLNEMCISEVSEEDFCAMAGKHQCDICGSYFIKKSNLEEHKRLRMYEEELEERFVDGEKL